MTRPSGEARGSGTSHARRGWGEDSRVLRRLRPFTESSRVAAAIRSLRRAGTRSSSPASEGGHERWPPLSYAQVAPPLAGSGLGAVAASVWRGLSTTLDDSAAVGAWRRAMRLLRETSLDRVVGAAAWMLAVAALSHLALLLTVERYHFPRQTAMVVPVAVAIVALLAGLRSGEVARALADRFDRERHR